MRLVVTGGGTGGHVYPALEVALGGRAKGWEIRYLGSLRGQEKAACEKVGVPFTGFPSEPVYRPLSAAGLKSLLQLARATALAARDLSARRPDAVFATGGYSAAPVLQAARRLRIPIVIHEQNAAPGRTTRIMGQSAAAVCTVFSAAAQHFPADRVHRTGMPIRRSLRESAQGTLLMEDETGKAAPMVLVMGGSQGSAALNDLALSTAVRMAATEIQWMHLTGLGHFESTHASLRKMAVRADYVIRAYLDAPEMAAALFNCSLALCRSGAGTMSELAAFRKPAILVPYPQAFANHQYLNALEFQEMGAAEVVTQGEIQPATLEARLHAWLNDSDRQAQARQQLAAWDVPDAVDRILDIVKQAGDLR